MSAHEIARADQAREGWTDTTLLALVLDYVDNQDDDAAFADYLAEHADSGDSNE
jgi:hypothetical protein